MLDRQEVSGSVEAACGLGLADATQLKLKLDRQFISDIMVNCQVNQMP